MKSIATIALGLLLSLAGFSQEILDLSFGNNGIQYLSSVPYGESESIHLQGIDKLIVEAFSSNNGLLDRKVYRLNLDGTLDTGFGDNGIFSDSSNIIYNAPGDVIVSNNAIFTATSAILPGSSNAAMTITRLTSDGDLDLSFANQGYSSLALPAGAEYTEGLEIEIDSNGNLIVGGSLEAISTGERSFIVARFLPNGALDSTFGTNGIYLNPATPGKDQSMSKLILNPDNSVVAVNSLQGQAGSEIHVVKLTADGLIDTGFATNGVYHPSYTESRSPTGATLLSNGSILINGLESNATGFKGLSTVISNSGTLETSYGVNGIGEGLTGSPDLVINYKQMIEHNGEYIFVGDVFDFTGFNGYRRIVVSKLNPNGTLISTYGTNGTLFFDSPNSSDTDLRGRAFLVHDDEFYVACSNGEPNFQYHPAVVKLVNAPVAIDGQLVQTSSIQFGPNPVNHLTRIEFDSWENQKVELAIVNVLGQTVWVKQIEIQAGENSIPLGSSMVQLDRGVYTLRLETASGKIYASPFMR